VFSFEGVNRSNAVVNFTEEDPIDPKALWLNSQHIYALTPEELTADLAPVVAKAGIQVDPAHLLKIVPLIQERIKTLNDVLSVADFFFADELAPYDPAELTPEEGHPRNGAHRSGASPESAGDGRVYTRRHGQRATGGSHRSGPESRTDVSTDPRGSVRTHGSLPRCLGPWKCWEGQPA